MTDEREREHAPRWPGRAGPRGRPRRDEGASLALDVEPDPRPAECVVPHPLPTVLVAEDDEGMRDFVSEVLRNGGFRVLAARDGSEGIALAEQDDLQIDCILTDQVMPGASGCDLAERARLRWTKVPVLLISGYAIDEGRCCERLGPMIAFLRKPFTPGALLDRLRALLAPVGA